MKRKTINELNKQNVQKEFDYDPRGWLIRKNSGEPVVMNIRGCTWCSVAQRPIPIQSLIWIWHNDSYNPAVEYVINRGSNDSEFRIEDLRCIPKWMYLQVVRKRQYTFKGCSYHKKRNYYQCVLTIGNHSKHIGIFKTMRQAAEAYDVEMRKRVIGAGFDPVEWPELFNFPVQKNKIPAIINLHNAHRVN